MIKINECGDITLSGLSAECLCMLIANIKGNPADISDWECVLGGFMFDDMEATGLQNKCTRPVAVMVDGAMYVKAGE